jgi:hypothetical protein
LTQRPAGSLRRGFFSFDQSARLTLDAMTTTLYKLIERKTHDRRYERGIFDEEILRDGAYDQIRACTEDC